MTGGRTAAWVRAHPADVVDLFVYVVVLNLAVEYLPAVISEGFTLLVLALLASRSAVRRLLFT